MGRTPLWVKDKRRMDELEEAKKNNDKKKFKELSEQYRKEYEEGRKKYVARLEAAEAKKAAKEKEKTKTAKKSTAKKKVVKKTAKKPVAAKKLAAKKKDD